MVFIVLVNKIGLLIALSIVFGMIIRRWERGLFYSISSGLLFGAITVLGMLTPLVLAPGLIFDGRSVILCLAGLFGGPFVAVIAASISIVYRLHIGGPGALMGVLVAIQSASLGVLYRWLARRWPPAMHPAALYALGVAVHLGMLALSFTLPIHLTAQYIDKVALPVILVFPVAFLLLSLFFLDQEARVRNEKRLRRSEKRYRQLFENLDNGFALHEIILDESGRPVDYRFLEVNPGFEKLTGLKVADILGRTVREVMPKTEQIWIENYGRVAQSGEPLHFENFSVELDKYFEVLAYCPEPGLFAVLFSDITRRKKIEAELRLLASAVQHAGESIVISDIKHEINYINPAFETASGYASRDIVGRSIEVLQSDKMNPEVYQTITETVMRGEVWSGHLVSSRKDGSLYQVEISISPVRDENGKITNFTSVARDVTHEMELESQLRQAQKLEAIGLLAGGVAHDLNNLLTPILGYADLILLEAYVDDSLRMKISEIMKAAEHARDLVQQLMAFGRKQTLTFKNLDLNAVVKALGKLLRRTLREDILIDLELTEIIQFVQADRTQLEQVLMNLAVNAQDAMPQGGTLTIETSNATLDENYTASHTVVQPGQYVLLSVSDNGCGMDETTQARIFEPFFTTKETGRGTGLGLATVYGIVKQHGGYIWVYSEPGRGSTFKIYLPAVDMVSLEDEQVAAPSGIIKGGETVLVAEDDPTVREMTCNMLQNLGYSVLTGETPEACLAAADGSDRGIDLLLTDVVMPQMSGKELFEKVRVRFPRIRVLFMSGYTANVIANRGVLYDGVHFIQKPFTLQNISEKIRQALLD